MHLPDPAVISFSAAVLSLATAITGVVRLILEKKSKSDIANVPRLQKKPNSVPRGISFLKTMVSDHIRPLLVSKKRLNRCTIDSGGNLLVLCPRHYAFLKKLS